MGKMKAIKMAIQDNYPEMAQELEVEFNEYLKGGTPKEELSPELQRILKEA